ncbi:MAG: DUF1559 domain-containing protein [Candidatus Omnitrophica bacterium]|nr:DUF1559 domain-containing protein [Candidatus Omnitrophota bacterium]
MLLPALSKAREKARQAVCFSNLKQIGNALLMYIQDYGDYIPFSYVDGGYYSGYGDNKTGPWFFLLAKYLNVPTYDFYRLGGPTWGNWLRKPCVFTCPTQRFTWPNERPVSYAPPISILSPLDWTGVRGGQPYKMAKYQLIKKPSQKVFIADSTSSFFFNPWQIDSFPLNGSYALTRHSEGTNVLFFDGHAEWIDKNTSLKNDNDLTYTGIFRPYDI